MTSPPKYLYKYRSTETEKDRERLKKMIEQGEIFFGSSFDFNDVFDCKPVFSFDCSDEEHVRSGVEFVRRTQGEEAAVRSEAWIRSGIGTERDPRHPKMRVALQESMAKMLGNWGIFCAAERPDNILMWSHYASSFTGVCIELDTREFTYLEKVRYPEVRPVINAVPGAESSSSAVDKALYTKSVDWKYEQEWRAASDKGLSRLSKTGITRVIFGPRCPSSTQAEVAGYVAASGKPIRLAAVEPDSTTFQLHIVDL